jgi:hypothetical protein
MMRDNGDQLLKGLDFSIMNQHCGETKGGKRLIPGGARGFTPRAQCGS